MREDQHFPYRDRHHAGQVLAAALERYLHRPGLLVLGLHRGGVPVAHAVAQALGAPLDVFIVRKLGYPGHEEYAMGAIASGGVRVLRLLAGVHVPQAAVEQATRRERAELERRETLYRGGRPPLEVQGRTLLVIDDGLATGATMEAAVQALRQLAPAWLCVAVPVGAAESCAALRPLVDDLVCPEQPEPFNAVSLWYREFPQTSDQEVQQLLMESG